MESADSRQRIAAGAWGQRHGRPAPSFWCRVLSSPPPSSGKQQFLLLHADAAKFRAEHPLCYGVPLRSRGGQKNAAAVATAVNDVAAAAATADGTAAAATTADDVAVPATAANGRAAAPPRRSERFVSWLYLGSVVESLGKLARFEVHKTGPPRLVGSPRA